MKTKNRRHRSKDRTPREVRHRILLSSPLMQLIHPACQDAIDRKLYGLGDVELQERIAEDMTRVAGGEAKPSEALLRWADEQGLTLADWQLDLADKVATEEREEYTEREYEVDGFIMGPVPERTPDYASMTTKELRPLASAAGMKGARVAKKAELVDYLTTS